MARMIPSILRLVGVWLRFCLALWLLPLAALAEPLPIKTWTAAQGLAHNHVIRIRRDTRGFLWFCTLEGLSRFDGSTFVTFDTRHGLPHLTVTDVLEARDGAYWVATNGGGVARFASFSQLTERPAPQLFSLGLSPKQQRVNTLFQDRQGRIWAGTDEGVFRLTKTADRETFQRVDANAAPHRAEIVTGFAEDQCGNLWISSWKGLFRLSPSDRLTHFSLHPAQGFDYVMGVLADRAGKVWAVARDFGVAVLDPADPALSETAHLDLKQLPVRWFTQRNGLPDSSIWSVHESADGLIWIGSEQHLTTWDGARWRQIGNHGTISKVSVDALAEDAAGNLWAGGMLGAMQIVRNNFTLWSTADGLSNDIPHAVLTGQDGAVLVVTNTPAIHRFNGDRFQAARLPLPPAALLHESTVSILQDRHGEWWLPTHQGLWRFPATADIAQLARLKPRAIYQQRQGLPPEEISRLFEDSRGDVWCSTAGRISLARWQRATERFTLYEEKDGVPANNPPLCYAEDRDGALWMGLLSGGLLRYRDGKFRRFGTREGLPGGAVQSLFVDRHNRLWIGSDTSGAACLTALDQEQPTVRRWNQQHGLSSDNVLALIEDPSGRLYFGTGRGLDWLDPATERLTNWHALSELNINPVNLLHCDREGMVWAGGLGGLLRLNPTRQSRPLPPVFLTALEPNETPLALPLNGLGQFDGIALPHTRNRLRIQFTSPWFVFGERPLYQYRLAGADAAWSAPSAQGYVNFANLPPGQYQFAARAVSLAGATGEPTVSVSFVIPPPFWQRGWFFALALASVATVGYLIYRWRLGQALRLERMRTRIATDLHDDIGANLTRILILSEVAKQRNSNGSGAISHWLDSIADIARESVTSMSDIVWAINPERDNLLDLTRRMRQHAEEVCAARDIRLQFRAPGDTTACKLDVNMRRDLYLIFKEAVNNVVRHSDCRQVTIDVSADGQQILLTIHDDGKGFDLASSNEGNGLFSMKNRADTLGGRLAIESSPGQGALVRLHVPQKRSWST